MEVETILKVVPLHPAAQTWSHAIFTKCAFLGTLRYPTRNSSVLWSLPHSTLRSTKASQGNSASGKSFLADPARFAGEESWAMVSPKMAGMGSDHTRLVVATTSCVGTRPAARKPMDKEARIRPVSFMVERFDSKRQVQATCVHVAGLTSCGLSGPHIHRSDDAARKVMRLT